MICENCKNLMIAYTGKGQIRKCVLIAESVYEVTECSHFSQKKIRSIKYKERRNIDLKKKGKEPRKKNDKYGLRPKKVNNNVY